jgi:hypothetical protein
MQSEALVVTTSVLALHDQELSAQYLTGSMRQVPSRTRLALSFVESVFPNQSAASFTICAAGLKAQPVNA